MTVGNFAYFTSLEDRNMQNAQENVTMTKTEEVTLEISKVAQQATAEDKMLYNSIHSKATSGEETAEVVTLTPPVAAMIFMETNKHNRDWRVTRSESLARQMENGEWKLNGQGLQFYKDGKLADGQHRTAAIALSGVTVKTSIFYGMEKESIVTIDCGTRRNAADALQLDGIDNAKEMEQIVKSVNAYEVRAKVDGVAKLESVAEVYSEVRRETELLEKAIDIGHRSSKGITSPVLSEREAAKIAYLFIRNGWDQEETAHRLAFFQAGQDDSESSPMFRVAGIISKSKDAKRTQDRVNANAMMGLVIEAFRLTEQGVKAVQPSKFKKIKEGKELPNPHHVVIGAVE